MEKDVLWEISNIKGLTVREILESHLLGHPFEGLFDIKDYTGSWCVFDLFPCIGMGNSLLQVMGTCRQGRRDFPRIIIFISSKGSGSTKRFDERNVSFTLLFFIDGWARSSNELDEAKLMYGIMDFVCGQLLWVVCLSYAITSIQERGKKAVQYWTGTRNNSACGQLCPNRKWSIVVVLSFRPRQGNGMQRTPRIIVDLFWIRETATNSSISSNPFIVVVIVLFLLLVRCHFVPFP